MGACVGIVFILPLVWVIGVGEGCGVGEGYVFVWVIGFSEGCGVGDVV